MKTTLASSIPSLILSIRTLPVPRVPLLSLVLLVLLVLLAHAPARGDTSARHTCVRVASDVVEVDGMLDDWRGVAAHRAGGTSRDARFSLRCAYDDARLYLAVDVVDERNRRHRRPAARSDDPLSIGFAASGRAAGSLVVFPGSGGVAPARTWNKRPMPDWLEVEDTLQKRGWSLEVAIPRRRLAGLGRGAVGIDARVVYRDADRGKVDGKVSFAGLLELEDSAAVYRAFLEAAKLTPRDIRLDQMANVDDTAGAERVVAGGAVIGVIGDRFGYMQLPVASPRDVLGVKLADLRGDGTWSIIATYRQRGNGGSRDVVAVYGVSGAGQFDRVLAFEVRKQLGDRVLVNRWSLRPRRHGRSGKARGHHLVIEVSDADATGWDEDSYGEAPALDVRGILLPWSDQTSALYSFDGNTVTGGGPATGGAGRRR